MTVPNDAAPETGRNCDQDESSKPFDPDSGWIDDFQKQLTPKLTDGLRNFARMRAYFVASSGRKVDDFYIREVVQDAIGDTWTGLLRWDPARCSLRLHLVRAIESRTDKHRKHFVDNPHDAIGDGTILSERAERDASSLKLPNDDAVKRVYSSEVMAQVRVEAARDTHVLRLLDAYDAGAQTKEDVLAHTKMKTRTYHNAHVRMSRIVRGLMDRKLAAKARA